MIENGNGSNGNGNRSFDDAIAALAAARAARDPVSAQRLALAPTRALALQYLEAFNRTAAEHRPTIESALEKYNRAFTEAGIRHSSLRAAIVEALTILDNGGNGFRSIVAEVDNLSAYQISQRHQNFIPARLESFRPNIGQVIELANRVAKLMPELEALVREAPLA